MALIGALLARKWPLSHGKTALFPPAFAVLASLAGEAGERVASVVGNANYSHALLSAPSPPQPGWRVDPAKEMLRQILTTNDEQTLVRLLDEAPNSYLRELAEFRLSFIAGNKRIKRQTQRAGAEVDAVAREVRRSCIAMAPCKVGGGPKVGERFRDCAECPEMVVVPAGSFLMGSPESEKERDGDEGPVHQVTIATPFALGVYEVTFSEWEACEASGGCGGYVPDDWGWGGGRRPVINVNWKDAQAYVRWLSKETGKRYRLPSESEWEYAARAGTPTPFHTGATISAEQANHDGYYTSVYGCPHAYGCIRVFLDSIDGGSSPSTAASRFRRETVLVGTFGANGWGIHEVHGNVWEWTEDCWNGGYAGAPDDGTAWQSGNCSLRVLRGGSWYSAPSFLRAANRSRDTTGNRNDEYGFRVARTLTP